MSGFNSVNDRLTEATMDQEYGGYIIGEVIDNVDPEGIERIKVKVAGLYDPDQGDVPWCGPHKKSPFGQGSGYGSYGTPAIGSLVRIKLQNGDVNYPLYEAVEYPKANANAKFKNPKTWGFKDPGGSELWVNYETGAWEFTHQGGSTIKHDADGNYKIHVAKDMTTDIVGNETKDVGGNSTTNIEGNEVTDVGGSSTNTVGTNFSISIGGNANVDVTGNLDVTAGGNTTVVSNGTVTISGSTINLN